MKRYLFVIILLLLNTFVIAQSMVNNLSIEFLNTNKHDFYYGEPITVQLEVKNHSSDPKYIHRISIGINMMYYLINENNGDTIGTSQRYWNKYKDHRERLSATPASEPFLMGQSSFIITEYLTTMLYGSNLPVYMKGVKYKNTLIDQLTAIPEGRYKLIVEYFILPGQEILKVEYQLNVLPLPEKEKKAYQSYLDATVYAANSWAYGDRNYQPDSPDSYETFIENYPESIFTEYAYFNLAENVYYYHVPTIFKDNRISFYDKFVLKEFSKSNLVGKKAHVINTYLEFTKGVSKKDALDKMLINLKDFAPGLSDKVIERSKEVQNIRGLQNRAKQLQNPKD